MRSTVTQERPTLPVEEQLVMVAPIKPRLEPLTVPAAPLSFAQERYWFLEQISPGDVSLNISRAIRLKGDLRQDLLEQSLTKIISRHESLRTTFAINQLYAGRDSKPAPMVSANSRLEISVMDISAEPETLARAAAQQPFDLTLGPLLRVTLIKLAPREHVLLLSAHRIVCDEVSLQILFAELLSAYSENQRTPPPLPIQYADYAAWQRNSIESTDLEFWRTKLHGAPAVIELPTDRPRPAVRTWHGKSTHLRFDNELVDHLRRIAADAGSSLDVLVLAALKVVLGRHSRQHDIVVGQTVSNRDHAETKDLVGPISNHLVVRSSLADEPTFLEFLSRVQHNAHEAHAHSVPFEKVLEELQLQPGLSHTPVFQASFQWQTDPGVDEFEFDDGVSRFDLMVEVTERPTHLDCRFPFSTDLFDDDTISRLATHLKIVLEGIAGNPNQKISLLPLLAPSELRQIVDEWNRTETVSEGRCVHELFEEQVERTPTAVAVESEETKLTYRKLNERANQLAHYLRSAGAGADVLVGVCIERSAELIIALLGILKAGAAYLPLETEYPAERLQFILNDSATPILITQKSLSDKIRTDARIVCLDEEEIRNQSRENPGLSVSPENLVYAIYTSGSTGKPKGTLITHRGLTNYITWATQSYPVAEGKGAPVHSSIAFDLTVTGLFTPLLVGRTAYLCVTSASLRLTASSDSGTTETQRTQRTRRDVESLISALKRGQGPGFSLIKITPAHLELLSHELTRAEAARCASAFIIGGEALTADNIKFWQEAAPDTLLVNEYGPTETVVGCCVYTVGKEDKRGSIPIGRPIANTRVYVLSPQLQPQPVGVPGELYIGGPGLARGYLNRPDLTAHAFVPDPFSTLGGERLYRTGDLARYRPDGKLEYLGRIDNQVKVSGFRIELEEIETVLRAHDAVENVAVVARQGKLLAYVVVTPEARTDLPKLWTELRGFTKTKLPEYMTPGSFVALDSLPVTPNGKVDRRALPNVDELRPDLEEPYVGPRDQIEERLTMLWTNVLQLKSIGVRDNFFELGGNSLLAARLFAHIANSFGKHLPLATLFLSPTIEQLANCLRDSDTSKTWSSLVAIQPEGSRPPLFCVHAAGANVLIYRPLSRHLGNDQPVYALQAQGLDGRTKPLTRVEDMAALYISEMRAVQPEGPYFLLGASFGGLVIYEMAQQLLEQNQHVALLAMLNTDCPVYSFAKRIRCHLGHLREKGPREYAQGIVNRRFKGRVSETRNETTNDLDPEIQKVLAKDSGVDKSLVRTVLAIMAAGEQYAPARVYPGKITFFWARDAKRDFEDNRLAWRKLAGGGFDVHVVPGTHTSMREEPHVAELAAKVRLALLENSVE
jgi:amino acid adenylation domain-containing protein